MALDDAWAAVPLGRGVTPLGRDGNGLAALAKPAGILSHPNVPADGPRSLLTADYVTDGEYYQWKGAGALAPLKLWLLNRLDSATSGVILVAFNAALAAAIRDHFKRKLVQKVYRALVFGKPRREEEIWRDRLAVEKRGGRIRAGAGHIPAESRMSVVRRGGRQPVLTLLQLEPRTGRSHQLRVQCAERALPIVGDQTYGDFSRNREFAKLAGTKRMFLHSLESRFTYEFNGRSHAFAARAPLPPEFEAFL